MRKCVVCQQMMEKKQLIRIVKTPENDIVIDRTGKQSGRGAYVCKNESCHTALPKNRALDRALKYAVPQNIYEQLANEFHE